MHMHRRATSGMRPSPLTNDRAGRFPATLEKAMFEVWTCVKVKNPEHARAGQAGVVHAVNKDKPDEVAVRFDLDGRVQLVATADLEVL